MKRTLSRIAGTFVELHEHFANLAEFDEVHESELHHESRSCHEIMQEQQELAYPLSA